MKLYFDQNGDLVADLVIISSVVFPKEELIPEQLGTFERQRLIINPDTLSRLKFLNKVGEILASFLYFTKPYDPFQLCLTTEPCLRTEMQKAHEKVSEALRC